MLTESELKEWSASLDLSTAQYTMIQAIRSSPPSRRVRGNVGNSTAFAQEMFLSSTVPRDWCVGNALPQLAGLRRFLWSKKASKLYTPELLHRFSNFLDIPGFERFFRF
jgi:hypothetical protein